MSSFLEKYKPIIDEKLSSLLVCKNELHKSVFEAMKYSLSVGGKRIRPALVMEFSRICKGNQETALSMACAIEMLHTYSLIHDDLPCMDDDDFRRGLPSCHKKFGEDIALLAGDGLLTMAFETISNTVSDNKADVLKCVSILSECAGANGMIGGQVIDLESEGKKVNLDVITKLNELKTSKLIEASAMLGCASAGADEEKLNAAKNYGYNLGIAFQIIDDILDVVGDEKLLGKPIGSDADNEKSTFVSIYGLEKAQELADEYTNKALSSLEVFGAEAEDLKSFSISLLKRDH